MTHRKFTEMRMYDYQNACFVLELSMSIDAADLATFLTNIHLFHYLSEEQIALVAAELVKHGIVPPDLSKEQSSLEDVFLKITGRSVVE